VRALDGLDFSVPQGAIHALVGSNGAGKTTLIKILMNIFRASSGTTSVLDVDSSKISGKAFASIGYVSENRQLPGWMPVGAFLAYLRPFYPTWDRQLETQVIPQFAITLSRHYSYEDLQIPLPICAGTKLVVSQPQFLYAVRDEIDLGNITLINYMPTYPRLIVPPHQPLQPGAPTDSLSQNFVPDAPRPVLQ
jgi:energy-coupling factor transporter ATP-binding protein EcfA2